MTYELRLLRAAKNALTDALPEAVTAAVWRFVSGPLLEDPRRHGKTLRYEAAGYLSARLGQYRVVYRIHEYARVVEVVMISHRRDAHG